MYFKQFCFQTGHSTEHAIIHLVDQVPEYFEYNEYPLGVFIELSKALNTVNHSILLKKVGLYGVSDRNHPWLKTIYEIGNNSFNLFEMANRQLERITQ